MFFTANISVCTYKWVRGVRPKNPTEGSLLAGGSGYSFKRVKKGGELLLLEEDDSEQRNYDPFVEVGDLYLRLTETKIESRLISDFAHKYGSLWSGARLLDSDGKIRPVTPISAWRLAIKLLRDCLTYYEKHGAHQDLVAMLNESLSKVTPEFVMDGLHPRVQMKVDNLWDTVFLQAVSKIADRQNLGQCKNCGELFERAPKRKNLREFCPDKPCRQQYDYHKRRKLK